MMIAISAGPKMSMSVTLLRACLAVAISIVGLLHATAVRVVAQNAGEKFVVDPFWPKPLPNNWILGQVASVAVDKRDHVWIVHRPGTLTDREIGAKQNPPWSKCCLPAPAKLGWPGTRVRLAGVGARHSRRRQRFRLAWWKRSQG
jgi:hypothetical protein